MTRGRSFAFCAYSSLPLWALAEGQRSRLTVALLTCVWRMEIRDEEELFRARPYSCPASSSLTAR